MYLHYRKGEKYTYPSHYGQPSQQRVVVIIIIIIIQHLYSAIMSYADTEALKGADNIETRISSASPSIVQISLQVVFFSPI